MKKIHKMTESEIRRWAGDTPLRLSKSWPQLSAQLGPDGRRASWADSVMGDKERSIKKARVHRLVLAANLILAVVLVGLIFSAASGLVQFPGLPMWGKDPTTGASTAAAAMTTTGSRATTQQTPYPYKDIKIERFVSAILAEGTLIPGEGSVWNTDKETFIKEIYGAELLDPKSDLFQESRNTTMTNGISSVQPLLHVTFEDIDKVSTTNPVYVFDTTEKLYSVNYKYNFETSQKDQYKMVVNRILDMVTLEKNTLVLKKENEIPDMNTFDFTKNKLMLTWFTVEQNQFFRLTSAEFQGHLLLDLTICNKPTLT